MPKRPTHRHIREGDQYSLWAGLMVMIALIVGGAWFYLAGQEQYGESDYETEVVKDPVVRALLSQQSSDELTAIEQDLRATHTTGLTSEVAAIESALAE